MLTSQTSPSNTQVKAGASLPTAPEASIDPAPEPSAPEPAPAEAPPAEASKLASDDDRLGAGGQPASARHRSLSEETGKGGGDAWLVRRGARGVEVRDLQKHLKSAGFNPGPVDGVFGPKTQAAVRAFQKARQLRLDGIVGPETRSALGIKNTPPASSASSSSSAPATGKAAAVIAQAKRFEGQRYVWGGGHSGRTTGVGGVDCSGLIQQAYRLAGLGSGLDGTAATQQTKGTKVSMNDLKPGDLLFHGTPASHVGLYIGNGKAIHASSTYGRVMIVDVKQYGYFNSARRIF